ncbi:MAG: hypothetical protein LCH36_01695 [Actinobacteria bacterium]|nr:hypothetical protein [Actinomycetota bacterium]
MSFIVHLPIATSVSIAARPTTAMPIHSQNIVFMRPSVLREPGAGQTLAAPVANVQ